MATFARSAWILDEDAERRATVALALESAGYEDIVAFEDGQQLLAHRARERPTLAVIDARTARFDARGVHRALSGVALIVLVGNDEHDEPWRALGVTLLLAKPTSLPAPCEGFGMHEGRSGTRTVPPELRPGHLAVAVRAGQRVTAYVARGQGGRSPLAFANSLTELLARVGHSVP